MTQTANVTIWLAVGFVGQAAFFSRFLVQWIRSEQLRRSVIPTSFWWLSMIGGAILLAYALHRRDPVFILGQLAGIAVYSRNLILLRNEREAAEIQRPEERRSLGA